MSVFLASIKSPPFKNSFSNRFPCPIYPKKRRNSGWKITINAKDTIETRVFKNTPKIFKLILIKSSEKAHITTSTKEPRTRFSLCVPLINLLYK